MNDRKFNIFLYKILKLINICLDLFLGLETVSVHIFLQHGNIIHRLQRNLQMTHPWPLLAQKVSVVEMTP
jgi:hypothetical protein